MSRGWSDFFDFVEFYAFLGVCAWWLSSHTPIGFWDSVTGILLFAILLRELVEDGVAMARRR